MLADKNDFVGTYAGVTGVKNGWTKVAGHTLVASAYRDGVELLVVVLGAGAQGRFAPALAVPGPYVVVVDRVSFAPQLVEHCFDIHAAPSNDWVGVE